MERHGVTLARFWPAWLAFVCTAGLAVVLIGILEAVLAAPEPGATDDLPPIIGLLLVAPLLFKTALIGLFVVPFRALIVRARAPFFRWGYMAVAALPLFAAVFLFDAWSARLQFAVMMQVPMALCVIVFVGLGRWLGAFGPDER